MEKYKTFSVIFYFEFCSLLPLESNLKLTNCADGAFDLPAPETLPRGGCCSVCHQGIGERKKGVVGREVTQLSVLSSQSCFVH